MDELFTTLDPSMENGQVSFKSRTYIKILVKVNIPRDQTNQNKEMKVVDSVFLVCSWEIMKSATSLVPPSTGLTLNLLNYLKVGQPIVKCLVRLHKMRHESDKSKL